MITGTAAVAIPGWKLSLTDFGYNFCPEAGHELRGLC